MVKDTPSHILKKMIGSAQTSREILEEGDVPIFLVVLITPKDLWYNRSRSVSHYPPSAWRLIQSVYDRIFSSSVRHCQHRTMRPRYVKSTKKDIKKLKDGLTGNGRGCAGTNNPGGTRKPNNTLKRIWNPIPQNPDNPLNGIMDIVQNRIRSQWPRGLTVPT